MYLNFLKKTINLDEFTNTVSNDNYQVFWEGLIFFPGIQQGIETMDIFLSSLNDQDSQDDIIRKINSLRGNWTLFVKISRNETWIICSDHSHQSHIFFNNTAISTSFLKLRNDQIDKSRLADEAVISILGSGRCYSEKIVYDNIKRLDYRRYLMVANRKVLEFLKRKEKDVPSQVASRDFCELINAYFRSLSKSKICCDFTGGYDTRIISIILDHYSYDFDVAINCNVDSPEARIARNAANLVGRRLQCFSFDPNQLEYDDIKSSWTACDGLSLSLDSYFFELWRKQLGYEVVVSGVGGNIFKDDSFLRHAVLCSIACKEMDFFVDMIIKKGIVFWWGLQAWELHNILSEKYTHIAIEMINGIKNKIIKQYSHYTINEAAHRILYEFSINCPYGTNNNLVNRYSPLIEYDLYRMSLNMSYIKKFNCLFYRKIADFLNPDIAKLPTYPMGTNLSKSYKYILSDYSVILKKGFQKSMKSNLNDTEGKRHNDLFLNKYLIEHSDAQSAMENLKDRKIINPNIAMNDITPKIVSNCLILHYLMEC